MDTKTRQHIWYLEHKERILTSRAAYRAANKQALKERAKRHYKNNTDKVKEKVKRYRETNHEQYLIGKRESYARNRPKGVIPRPPKKSHEQQIQQNRAYYQKNKFRINQVRKLHRKQNSEKLNQQRRNYLASHPDVVETISAYKRVWNEHRRAIKKNTLVTLTKWQVKSLLTKCFFCGSTERLTIAHDTPVIKGGNTTRGNVFCLCQSCNSRMGSKSLKEILTQQELIGI